MSGRGMESTRQFRARFAHCKPIDIAGSKFMTARRKAARRLRSRMPGQCRAFQALNCMGRRIWANKPRLFKGYRWRAACATVERSIARGLFRASREWQRRGEAPFSTRRALYAPGVGGLCVTGGAVAWAGMGWAVFGVIDAPICIPAGACRDLSPFWFPGDDAPQVVIARESWR